MWQCVCIGSAHPSLLPPWSSRGLPGPWLTLLGWGSLPSLQLCTLLTHLTCSALSEECCVLGSIVGRGRRDGRRDGRRKGEMWERERWKMWMGRDQERGDRLGGNNCERAQRWMWKRGRWRRKMVRDYEKNRGSDEGSGRDREEMGKEIQKKKGRKEEGETNHQLLTSRLHLWSLSRKSVREWTAQKYTIAPQVIIRATVTPWVKGFESRCSIVHQFIAVPQSHKVAVLRSKYHMMYVNPQITWGFMCYLRIWFTPRAIWGFTYIT